MPHTNPSTAKTGKPRYIELDVLRGVAILMMVINHFGFVFLTKLEQTTLVFHFLIFMGSFAPVLFYFVTGVGYGINSQSEIKSGYWSDTFFKVFILIVIERIAHIDEIIGMDFLSFIAFLIMLLSAIRFYKIKHSILMILCLLLFAARFIIGPVISTESFPGPVIKWLLGVEKLDNFSYPLIPWVFYPLMGYVLGEKLRESGQTAGTFLYTRWKVVVSAAVVITGALFTVAYLKNGFLLFRWGTVSLDFFILSLLILIIFTWLAIIISRSKYNYLISMAGITSLLVVPTHYYLLEMTWLNVQGETLIRLINMLLFLVIVFILAKVISRIITDMQYMKYAKPIILLQSVILFSILVAMKENVSEFLYVTVVFILQITLSYFFLVRPSTFAKAFIRSS